MSGYYLMHRGWLDHPVFGGVREPYCRRAAWAWLIDHAVYEEVKVGVTNKTITLQRGQLSYSLRYLANAWGWDDPKVRRFLTRLVGEMMIDTVTDAGQTVITIRNYEQYQSFRTVEKAQEKSTDAPSDAATTQERRSNDANNNSVNTESKNTEASASVGALPLAPAHELAVIDKAKKPRKAPKVKSKLPKDWFLPMEWGQWALDQGADTQLIRRAADRFKSHHVGSGTLKADWREIWCNWIRSDLERTQNVKQSSSSKSEDLFDGLVNAAFDIMDAGAGAHNVVPLRTAASAW
jgi:hypothetical protein